MRKTMTYCKAICAVIFSAIMLSSGLWLLGASFAGKRTTASAESAIWHSLGGNYESFNADWGEAGINSTGGSDDNRPLEIGQGENKQVFEKGIWAHAGATITYDLTDYGDIILFESYAGICSHVSSGAQGNAGSVEFIVEADGVQIYKSHVVRWMDSPLFIQAVVPIGTQVLTLKTTDAGMDGNAYDHSIWADPKVREVMADDFLSITATAEGMLKPDETSQIQLSAVGVEGQSLSVGSAIFSSSNETAVTVSSSGLITAKSKGIAIINVEVEKNGIKFTKKLEVVVVEESEIFSIHSPNEKIVAEMFLNDNGTLLYGVKHDGKVAVRFSEMGLVSNVGDFTSGLSFVNSSNTTINETYSVASAKKAVYENKANEATYVFSKNDASLEVTLRAYDDGFAFRYRIISTNNNITVSSENSGFNAPIDSVAWVMGYQSGAFSYEDNFSQNSLSALNGNYIMPFLYETPQNLFVLISEAALNTDYPGSMITATGENMKIAFSAQQGANAAIMTTYFYTPWRMMVVGGLNTITETVMAENLSPEPDEKYDYDSWVKPGITAWSWLENVGDFAAQCALQYDPDAIKRYITLAADMGWDYFIMDEGWHKGGRGNFAGFYDWFDDVLAHANDKGIGLIAWVHNDDLSTPAKRAQRLDVWAAKGIKGIKVDFFDSEAQNVIKNYEDIYKACAELKLVVNAHGANKSTGEVRTYPHVLTREAIRGQEMGYLSPYQYTIIPYTRAAIGPSDVTETPYAMNSASTTGFQAATAILVQSGMHCFGGASQSYYDPANMSLYKNFPKTWDDVKFVEGYPGKYSAIARRAGDDWYLAEVSAEARTASFNLSFLSSGKYYAVVYTDNLTSGGLEVYMQEVTSADTLEVPVAKNGGCAVKILKEKPTGASKVTLDKTTANMAVGELSKLSVSAEPSILENQLVTWTSSNSAVASVSGSQVTAIGVGKTTITATSIYDNSVKSSCEVYVGVQKYAFTNGFEQIRPTFGALTFDSTYDITIPSSRGEFSDKDSLDNLITYAPSSTDFEVSVKVSGGLSKTIQTAGILVFDKDDSAKCAGVLRRYRGGNIFYALKFDNGWNETPINETAGKNNDDAWLRLVKSGNTISTYISYDGSNWTKINDIDAGHLSNVSVANMRIGLCAVASTTNSFSASFADFTYNGNKLAFVKDRTELFDETIAFLEFDKNLYTADSWASYQTAYNNAVLVTNSTSDSDVTSIINSLKNAKNALALKPQDNNNNNNNASSGGCGTISPTNNLIGGIGCLSLLAYLSLSLLKRKQKFSNS